MASAYEYDVYISYNTFYRSAAIQIAQTLIQRGAKIWIDVWFIRPGDDWQKAARQALVNTRTALILIGQDGIGSRGQTDELNIILSSNVNRIIPVLLPNTSPEVIPPQLKHLTWVDFKGGLDDENTWQYLMLGIFPLQSASLDEPAPPESEGKHAKPPEHLEEEKISPTTGRRTRETDLSSIKDRESNVQSAGKDLIIDSYQRVLNAGFALPAEYKRRHFAKPDAPLYADEEYILLVDVGPVWKDVQSLVIKNDRAIFPEDHLPDDQKGYLVRVVFVSEDFTPHLVSAEMWVPRRSGQSYPYVNGERASAPDPVGLAVHTPSLQANQSQTRAHGRLCLYYKGQVIQSAIVSVGVARAAYLKLEESNKIEVDYVLTSNLTDVAENLGNRLAQIQQGEEARPVSVNLTLNDDGSGRHRILATYHLDTKEESTVPPAWAPYDAESAQNVLAEFRQVMASCYKSLDAKFGKPRKQFGLDLLELAKIGDKLRTLALSDLDISETGRTVALWRRELLKAMRTATVIQIARTGPANYVFPWALVYEYPMPGPEYKLCQVITEWNEDGVRSKLPEMSCPYAEEDWHQENIVCPYGFWGLKHIIEQPPGAIRKKDGKWSFEVSNKILTHKDFGLGMGITFDIDGAKRDEHIQRLTNSMAAHLVPQNLACDRKTVLEMLHDPDVVYFLCHGETDPNLIPYLSVGEHVNQPEYMIFPNTLEQWSSVTRGGLDLTAWAEKRPLVFINGCHTAQLQPGIVLNFVSAFADLGASGVIGTEVSVLAEMAMVIAEAILCRVGTGMEVGQAVREMRWEMLNRGNLLGLAYTPYSLANLHIERTL